ncbi:peptidoglycan recognition family protein [Geomonas sp.]|uniref:N-acetylmuramoyl-L-alanine amidase n=1 Tax=Geomonas sp. TaxID=2651584 RepID=UPI002B47C081|nr:peptidoglycan recognition family protein [Geomonas sp.]HJV33782.1 peptidoglycan recognition family protein [Geomonas sp.]
MKGKRSLQEEVMMSSPKFRPRFLLFTLAMLAACTHAPHSSATVADQTAPPSAALAAPPAPRPSVTIIDHDIFDQQRLAMTRQYCQLHYGTASERLETPKMIVVHYTASPTLQKALDFFTPDRNSRDDIRSGGEVNVSAQFLIDKDGTIYRLAPEDRVCRHTIGFNQVALGIENVAEDKDALTDAQLEADAALIADLAARHPSIRYLIGHYEYQDRSLPHFALRTELDPSYHPTVKIDPGERFMTRLRALLKERYGLTFER